MLRRALTGRVGATARHPIRRATSSRRAHRAWRYLHHENRKASFVSHSDIDRPMRTGIGRATVVTVLVAAVLLGMSSAPRAADAAPAVPPCGAPAVADPIPLPGPGAPAGPVLRHLATQLRPVPGESRTGRYTRISLTQNAADTAVDDCVTTVLATTTQTMWRDEITNSGWVTGTPMHTVGTPAPPVRTLTYGPGELPGILPGRAPADPQQLAAALSAAVSLAAVARLAPAMPCGCVPPPVQAAASVDLVRGIIDLARWHDTPLRVRQAILIILSDVPGLRVYGPLTTAGRTGLLLSVAASTHRYVLLVDALTGVIHATQDVLTDPTLGQNLAVHIPYALNTVLFGHGTTNHLFTAARR